MVQLFYLSSEAAILAIVVTQTQLLVHLVNRLLGCSLETFADVVEHLASLDVPLYRFIAAALTCPVCLCGHLSFLVAVLHGSVGMWLSSWCVTYGLYRAICRI